MRRKWRSFVKMPFAMKLMLAEAYVFLGWSRILKLFPFSKVAPNLGVQMAETSWSHPGEDERMIRRVARAVRTMSRYTWWESKCLVRAIAAMKMLRRRGIDSTLYLGTAKDKSGQLVAHAWLRSGPYYLTGAEEMEQFTVVGKFGYFAPDRRGQRRHRHG